MSSGHKLSLEDETKIIFNVANALFSSTCSLINLGFRASGFEIREGSKSTTSPKSATTVTTHKHLIKKKPLVVRKTASEPQRVEQGVRKTEER